MANWHRRCGGLLLGSMALVLTGCPVPQTPPPAPPQHLTEGQTGRDYWLYVPTKYNDQHPWPMVVTLHGTHGWDGPQRQIGEWGALAEEHEFLVLAPSLKSVQGILPIPEGLWMKDLAEDEKAVLGAIDEVCRKWRVDPKAILLTGFSAGGYPLYHIGLRNPTRFNMLIARDCNSSVHLLEKIELTDEARKLPMTIFWGKDDMRAIQDQSWEAFNWLRRHRCFAANHQEIRGGHLRRPDVAYTLWVAKLSPKYRI